MNKYLYWLDRVEGLGPLSKRNLLEAFGSARNVFEAREHHLKYILEDKKLSLLMRAKEEIEVEEAYNTLIKKQIQIISYYDGIFPEKLKSIPDPPFCLYYKGNLPSPKFPSVAVIGARECSGYGEYIAFELGKLLGNHGIQVISGMARGIDGITQTSALCAGGVSYGVLGCGVDICYPKSNQKLYDELLIKGGIISTYPPGTLPQAKLFPPRNRIVSGLADVLVVIEARCKSGTSITVEMALEQGRDIFAVPGRITDRLSDGCNKMLKEGAHVFLSPEDFLMDLETLLPIQMEELEKHKLNFYSDEKHTDRNENDCGDNLFGKSDFDTKINSILDYYPKSIEEIRDTLIKQYRTEVKEEELVGQLMMMSLVGRIKQDSAGWYSKI